MFSNKSKFHYKLQQILLYCDNSNIYLKSLYNMFTKLYLETTNPQLKFNQLFIPTIFVPMLFSVMFHTIIYALFCNMVSYIFLNKILTNQINIRLIISLILIMFFGFFARFLHVKDVYSAYNGDMVKTRNHLDKLYISWIFIS